MSSSQHQLCSGISQIVAENAQGVGPGGLLEHIQLPKPHAQVRAQGRLLWITCMQNLQVIPSQLQTQLHCAGVLLGTPGAT
ncbi:hypothetical protein D3C77_575970 [compost metagenome]